MALEGIIIEVGGSKVILRATLLSSYHFSLEFVVFGSSLIKKAWPGTVIASFYNEFVTVHWLITFPPHSVVNVTFIGSLLVQVGSILKYILAIFTICHLSRTQELSSTIAYLHYLSNTFKVTTLFQLMIFVISFMCHIYTNNFTLSSKQNRIKTVNTITK